MFRCSVTFQGWLRLFLLYYCGKFLIWVLWLLLTFLTKLSFQVWVWKIEEEGKSWKQNVHVQDKIDTKHFIQRNVGSDCIWKVGAG